MSVCMEDRGVKFSPVHLDGIKSVLWYNISRARSSHTPVVASDPACCPAESSGETASVVTALK